MRLLLILLICVSASGADWYVSPTGNDSTGDGSIGNPYLTAQHAADQKHSGNIWLRGGSYTNFTLSLNTSSHSNLLFSSYAAESAVCYGGQVLTGWSAAGSNGWYAAPLPTFPTIDTTTGMETTWDVRGLMASGRWVPRAKDPGTGKYSYTSFSGTALVYTNAFANTTNGEIQSDNSWNDTEVGITAINTGTKTITTTAAMDRNGNNSPDTTSFTMLNTPAGMTLAEQFWWDKTNNTIVYAGPDPSAQTMIVPTVARMVLVQGFSGSEITNIVFSNLTFACTTAPINGGQKDDVGTFYAPALDFIFTTNGCAVRNCTVYGCAGQGIGNDNTHPATGMIVTGCTIHDIGASGIEFPGANSVTYSNNLIYNCGQLCQAGCGIVGFNLCSIQNNTITNVQGAGIWIVSGGVKNTNVVISGNRIIQCAQQLRDLGAIYTVMTTNLLIISNVVAETHSISNLFYNWTPLDATRTNWNGLHGIYCDFGTEGALVVSNILYNCTKPLIHHLSSNNVVRQNYFIQTRASEDMEIDVHNSTNHPPLLTNNVIYVAQGWPRLNCEDGNYIPYNVNTNIGVIGVSNWVGNITWSAVGNNGFNPTNATTSDPQFKSVTFPKSLGFSGSTAPSLGIQPMTFFDDVQSSSSATQFISGATLSGFIQK